ncbi:MAG: TPM domain-containing protein, partial [Candidatus Eremiobacteraeota bacterium]|nr:TPM domain-containing protein [Candidatus Eremiobacteraeota bacterium]
MNRLLAFALALSCTLPALPALARDFVVDQAGMFSASTVSDLNAKIGSFNAQTGKDVVVVTVPSLNGTTLTAAASNAFSQQNVNGVMIFIARDDRRDIIVPDRAGARWFTPGVLAGIRQSMESQFKAGNFDAGIAAGVDGVLGVYRSHVGSLRQTNGGTAAAPASSGSSGFSFGGFHLSMFWWIVIIVVGFLVLRSIFRAFSGPRYMGPPTGGGMPPGGYGPGYGPGYGYGGGGWGGGGGFWSGLLGGLGGAWLGNEMFGQHGGIADAGQQTQIDNSGGYTGGDASGWQSDAGQADMSGASGGDWGGGG